MAKDKKKNTSLRLETKVLKELKIIAIEEDTSIQAILESLVKNFIQTKQKNR